MLRPGISQPGVGAARTRRQRQQLLQRLMGGRARTPRFGAPGMRPVAGPGVRQFSGRGPLRPAALDALTNRFNEGVIPFNRPIPGLPEQANVSLDQLPDPGAGPRDDEVFMPTLGRDKLGFGSGPNAPLAANSDYVQSLRSGPQYPVLANDPGQLAGLIPLGGGSYYDPAAGQIYGSGSHQYM